MIRFAIALVWAIFAAQAAFAQGFSGLARLDAGQSRISGARSAVQIDLALSQGIPYRVFTLDAPRRLVLDFREVDWRNIRPRALIDTDQVTDVRVGGFREGWSRMVVDLAAPLMLDTSEMQVDAAGGGARLQVRLRLGDEDEFSARAGMPVSPQWDYPDPAMRGTGKPARAAGAPLVIVLDPGHGGIDPGAEHGEHSEKDLMLSFARQLKETLLRTGEYEVVLTREADHFVSLERRVAIAHQSGADVFISLHADALSEGSARGATVYPLSDDASDAASAALAERHNRADMLAGIDLTGTDDVVADVLMDLARMETQPRADLLARAMVLGLREMDLALNGRPLRGASFSVLKSPDIPSVLLELGFMSNTRDIDNLADADWRLRMAVAISDALGAWARADAAAAHLVRQ